MALCYKSCSVSSFFFSLPCPVFSRSIPMALSIASFLLQMQPPPFFSSIPPGFGSAKSTRIISLVHVPRDSAQECFRLYTQERLEDGWAIDLKQTELYSIFSLYFPECLCQLARDSPSLFFLQHLVSSTFLMG